MMRPVFFTRLRRAAFQDYRITIEKSERRQAIARDKRSVKTSHDPDDVGRIRRLDWGKRIWCGEACAYR
jgi:hypothetical protein